MEKKIKAVFCVGVCMLFLFLFAPGAKAGIQLTDKIDITGYVENETGVRLEDGVYDSGNLSRSRFTLNLEAKWDFLDYLKFGGIIRGFSDQVYNFDSSINKEPLRLDSGPDGERMDHGMDFREYYLDYYVGDLSVRIGRQQVVWGESDALRMSDIINPLDLSWQYLFKSWEDIRIPLRMVKLLYEIPSANNLFIELVFNLEDFRANTLAPEGANWAIPGAPQMLFDQMTDEMPDASGGSGAQGGARVGGIFGAWDLKAFFFRGMIQDAVFKFDGTHAPLPLGFEFPYITTTGATFNVFDPYTKTVFRGECAYTFDQPFKATPVFYGPMLGTQPSAIKKADTFAFMLGLDRPTWIKFLNPDKTFFISAQLFRKWALDADNDIIATGMGRRGDEHDMTVLTFLINTDYMYSTIKPEILVAHDINGTNGFCKAQIIYEPNFTFGFSLGYIGVWGHQDNSGTFGPARKNDELVGSIRIKF